MPFPGPKIVRPTAANGFGGVLAVGRLRDLVAAAAGADEPATAWRRYRAAPGAEAADEGERRLYPFVGSRLDAAALADPAYAPIRTQRRAAHVRHELLFNAAEELADLFGTAGIRPIFLKGLAVQIRAYGDRVIRASSDIDIFVAPDELGRCLALIEQAKWVRKEERPRTGDPGLIAAMRVKMTWRMPRGVLVDIHWVPREPLEFDAALTADFVASAVARDYRGRTWLIPSDPWLLFEAIEHGVTWNEVTPIRWLIDALAILRIADTPMDWDRLCALIERNRLTRIFAIGLGALADYGDDVPESVIARLSRQDISLMERLYTRTRLTLPGPLITICTSLSHVLLRHPARPWRRAAAFPAYYRMRTLRCMTWSEVAGRALGRFRTEQDA